MGYLLQMIKCSIICCGLTLGIKESFFLPGKSGFPALAAGKENQRNGGVLPVTDQP